MDDLQQSHEDFINFLKSKSRAGATILAYGNDIAQFVDFISQFKNVKSISQISKEDIEDFKKDLLDKGYTTKSVARKLNSIKTYFRFLVANNNLSLNPSKGIEHPKYTLNPPRILTKMEYRSLRDACRNDKRMYAIVELFLQTGIRISELARLQISDVFENKIRIDSYEAHEERIIPLNKPAYVAIQDWLTIRPESENNSLFITKTGNTFQVRNIRTSLDRYFRLADIRNATVNDLRHTFIAHQLRAGTPLTIVSKLAGHRRLSTTEKYMDFINNKESSNTTRLEEL